MSAPVRCCCSRPPWRAGSRVAAVALGVRGLLLLARGESRGLALLDSAAGPFGDLAAARRSFRAALVCVPILLMLHVLSWMTVGFPDDAAGAVLRDLLGFAIGWVGFALLSHRLVAIVGRERRWLAWLVVWNWSNVAQYAITAVAGVPDAVGLPPIIGQTVWLVALGWAFWLEWFITRLALDVPGPTAAAFVAADLTVGLIASGIVQ